MGAYRVSSDRPEDAIKAFDHSTVFQSHGGSPIGGLGEGCNIRLGTEGGSVLVHFIHESCHHVSVENILRKKEREKEEEKVRLWAG